jgi:transmembrane 9 superfamily protein 3
VGSAEPHPPHTHKPPLLPSADHRWHWHSFLSGASVGLYVFLYAIYFYIFKTEMTGLLQAAFYFGYSALACSALGITTGTIGTAAATAFVRAIYASIKAD